MATGNTPRFVIPLVDANQAQGDVTHNLAILRLDVMSGGAIAVINSTTTAPPGSPAFGDCYLTGTGCTGLWAGHDTQIAYYHYGWYFISLTPGMIVYDKAADVLKVWRNAANFGVISHTP